MNVVKLPNGPKADQRLELPETIFPNVVSGKVTYIDRPEGSAITLGYLEFFAGKNTCTVLVMGVTKTRIEFMSPAETAELYAE